MHKLLLKNAYLENDLIRVMEFEPEESATEAVPQVHISTLTFLKLACALIP